MIHKLIPLMLALFVSSCCCGWRKHEDAAAPKPDAGVPDMTVVATAAGARQFATLTAAIRAAGLESTLSGPGPFTVFAPTDAAFAALPAGALESLLANEAELKSVLTYHVVAGELLSSSLVNGARIPTLNGKDLDVRIEDGLVFVGGARVQSPDLRASNGVVHQIDRVLTP